MQPFKSVRLYHSRLFSIPIVGELLYRMEIFFIQNYHPRKLWASNFNHPSRQKLFEAINQKYSRVFIRSTKFGNTLNIIKKDKIADFVVSTPDLPKNELFNLMWSLVSCDSVTIRTRQSLGDFLPPHYPIFYDVFIPLRDPLDIMCDPVLQTAQTLALLGHRVNLLAYQHPLWIGIWCWRQLFGCNCQLCRKVESMGMKLTHTPTVLPSHLTHRQYAHNLNRDATERLVAHYLGMNSPAVLWCFDPSDIALARYIDHKKITVLSDIVDYFSSLDRQTDTQIKKSQLLLISQADLVCVNSRVLKQLFSKVRSDIEVVPQGFDLPAFSGKSSHKLPISLKVKRLISKIKSLPGPKLCFIGGLTFRIDFNLITAVIEHHPQATFLFTDAPVVWPSEDKKVNTKSKIQALKQLPNIIWLPHLNRSEVRAVLEISDICLIPYNTNYEFNLYCYPMKLFEYFYVGKPVISTPIEELKHFKGLTYTGNNISSWNKYIRQLSEESWSEKKQIQQRNLAIDNSWNKKTTNILNLLRQKLSEK